MRVLLNGINAISAGGSSVVRNIVEILPVKLPEIHFDLIIPNINKYYNLPSMSNLSAYFFNRQKFHSLNRLIDIKYRIKELGKKYKADLCFTLGDLGPIKLDIPHLVLLQQAIFVYVNEDYEKLWKFKDRIKFSYSRQLFKQMSKNTNMFTVQTPVMAKRLNEVYNINNNKIVIVPSIVPFQGSLNKDCPDNNIIIDSVNKPCRLLFLSAPYPHKNFQILPKVMMEIKKRKLNEKIHFFLTIPNKSRFGNKTLRSLLPYSDCLTNLGELKSNEVPGAIKSSSALFLPTLVESFGLIYLEAMKYECPIITSDRDFSRWMCGESAIYFDPLDENSIVNNLENFCNDKFYNKYINKANQRLNYFPNSWDDVAYKYSQIIVKMLNKK